MRAWEKLIGGSTIVSGNAWAHLQAQGGGATQVVHVERVDANFSDIVLNGFVSEESMGADVLHETKSSSITSEVINGAISEVALAGSGVSAMLSGNFLEDVV